MRGRPDVLLVINNYIGVFYKRDKNGHWRKFHQIGNAEISLHVASLIRKLNIKVTIREVIENAPS